MCTVTLRQSAIFTVACLLVNGFNMSVVLVPEVKAFLKSQPWFSYIPDVHNVSLIVSQESSDYIMLGLAGASVFFDLLMFGGCITKIPQLLDVGCLWHYFDLGADLIVGFASANYSRPAIVINKTIVAVAPVKPSLCMGVAPCSDDTYALDVANATLDDGAANQLSAAVSDHRATVASEGNEGSPGKGNLRRNRSNEVLPRAELLVLSWKDNPYKILLEPPTVRQFLHFPYVVGRAFVKCQMLGMYGIFVRHYKK